MLTERDLGVLQDDANGGVTAAHAANQGLLDVLLNLGVAGGTAHLEHGLGDHVDAGAAHGVAPLAVAAVRVDGRVAVEGGAVVDLILQALSLGDVAKDLGGVGLLAGAHAGGDEQIHLLRLEEAVLVKLLADLHVHVVEAPGLARAQGGCGVVDDADGLVLHAVLLNGLVAHEHQSACRAVVHDGTGLAGELGNLVVLGTISLKLYNGATIVDNKN